MSKAGGGVRLDWTGATVPLFEGHFHVLRAGEHSVPFALEDHDSVTGTDWTDLEAVELRVLYEIRSADGCERQSGR